MWTARRLSNSVEEMVKAVQAYVPGYRLKNEPVFEVRDTPEGKRTLIAMLLEVTGAGDFLPSLCRQSRHHDRLCATGGRSVCPKDSESQEN